MSLYKIKEKQVGEKVGHYISLCIDNKIEKRLWISPDILQKNKDDYLHFPIVRSDIKIWKNDYLVVSGEYNVFNVYIKCGIDGISDFTIAFPINEQEYVAYYYYDYESLGGKFGISKGALVKTKSRQIIVYWQKKWGNGKIEQGQKTYRWDGTVNTLINHKDNRTFDDIDDFYHEASNILQGVIS